MVSARECPASTLPCRALGVGHLAEAGLAPRSQVQVVLAELAQQLPYTALEVVLEAVFGRLLFDIVAVNVDRRSALPRTIGA